MRTCLIDNFYPEAGLDAINLLEHLGYGVLFPQDQTCSGQPDYNTGFAEEAQDVARTQLNAFALDIPVLVDSLKGATGFLVDRRAASIHDPLVFEEERKQGEAIKQRALSKLPDLLAQMERNCQKNGIQVHWAETSDQANQIIEDIRRSENAKNIVKSKSMVTEEIEMNHHLASAGIECIECDKCCFHVFVALAV